MIGREKDHGILVQALFLELCNHLAEVFIERFALSQIIRVFLHIIAVESFEIGRAL